MCTVTVVPDGDGFRMICNRDERRDRPAALPPTVHRVGDRTAVYPVDPHGGGTWVGLNDCGLAVTLLNRTPEVGARPPASFARSRGLIVPALLGCASLDAALSEAQGLEPSEFDLFRLLLVERMMAGILTSDGRTLSVETSNLTAPIFLTSSSLGDSLVEEPRHRLFESMVLSKPPSEWLDAQSRFHAHRWRSQSAISVTMARGDARTVSRTFVQVTARGQRLRYHPLRGGPPVRAA
jgi:hypothetical protein